MPSQLTKAQEALLAAVRAGDAPPDDQASRQRLLTLKRLGYITRERTADGDKWTAGEAKPKANQRARRSRKRAAK